MQIYHSLIILYQLYWLKIYYKINILCTELKLTYSHKTREQKNRHLQFTQRNTFLLYCNAIYCNNHLRSQHPLESTLCMAILLLWTCELSLFCERNMSRLDLKCIYTYYIQCTWILCARAVYMSTNMINIQTINVFFKRKISFATNMIKERYVCLSSLSNKIV